MATVNKNFKIKSGLVVEGTTGTINNHTILTEVDGDAYILDLIGGETLITAVDTDQLDVTAGLLSVKSEVFDDFGSADAAQDAAEAFATAADTTLYGTVTDDIATAKSEAGVIAQGYADTAEADAIAAAALDATTKADAAEDAAIAAAALDATTKADAAEDAANSYTDGRETAITTAYQSYADQAELDAVATANAYTDAEVAALVGSAPELLDTLNELAAAINDNPNYATDVANLVAGKQDTLTAGTNISIVDDTVSVVGLASTDISDFATASQSANIGYYDPAGSAQTAEDNAKQYADGLAVNYDAAGSASSAQTAAETFATNAINALDTDDIEEGATNLYFTNQRAIDAVGGTLTDAINEIDTDDIEEGTSNLYFTDQRARDAVANDISTAVAAGDDTATPVYLAVNLADVAKQVAAQVSVPTASEVTAISWASADYRSAELLVKVAYGTHTEVSKVVLTLDTSDNVAITEYAVVGTNGSASTVSADVSGSDVRLRVTTANNNSTVTVAGTLLV
jgi:hypothetical protein